jgi:hypothetical protein
LAQKFSKTIEAFCWEPKSKISHEEYQLLVESKTDELCHALFSQHLDSSMDHQHLKPQSNQSTASFQEISSDKNISPFSIPPLAQQRNRLPPLSSFYSV